MGAYRQGEGGRGLSRERAQQLLRALARAGNDDEAVARVGTHWATEQCRDLIDAGVAGLHFYTLNKSASTRRIYETLGARTSAQLRPG